MGTYKLKGRLVYTNGGMDESDECKIVLTAVVKGMVFTKDVDILSVLQENSGRDVEIIIKLVEKKREYD